MNGGRRAVVIKANTVEGPFELHHRIAVGDQHYIYLFMEMAVTKCGKTGEIGYIPSELLEIDRVGDMPRAKPWVAILIIIALWGVLWAFYRLDDDYDPRMGFEWWLGIFGVCFIIWASIVVYRLLTKYDRRSYPK